MCRLFLMTIACLALLFGISGLYMMPKLLQRKIEERMQLKIGTKNFERFTRVPIALKVRFYFFNVTNSEQVLKGLERPHFQEVGPFIYEQWRRRSVVDIIDNNRKLTYKEFKTFYSLWPAPGAGVDIESRQREPRLRYLDNPNEIVTDPKEVSDILSGGGGGGGGDGGPNQRAFMLNPYAHNVTIVNLPLLSMLTKLADLDEGSLKRRVASKVLSRLIKEGQEKILVNRRVNELLFDGYKVGVLEAANELVSNVLGFNFESPLPGNKFGFFHGKNNTWKRDENGELTIYTGRNESMNDFMLVDSWNGQHELNTWPRNTLAGNRCNEIRGTDGSQFHPGVTRDHVLDIFSPLICSSLQVKYKEDTSCRDIPLLRFTTTAEMFAAPMKSTRNACYCAVRGVQQHAAHLAHLHLAANSSSAPNWPLHQGPVARDAAHAAGSGPTSGGRSKRRTAAAAAAAAAASDRCYKDGLIDLSPCQKGAPVAASPPHFYNGDPMLWLAAGLQPRQSRHETYMDIEPMTGTVMRAASRAQLNAFVEEAALEVVDSATIGHMTPMVAPLMWLEESAQIDERSANEFKARLLNTVNKAHRSFFYSIIIGFLLVLGVSLEYWYTNCYKIDASIRTKRAELRDAKRRRKDKALEGGHGRAAARSARRTTNRHHQQQQQSAGRTTAPGAWKSHLAGQMQLVAEKRPLDEQLERSDTQLAGAAMAVAVALGAADSAAARSPRSQQAGAAARSRVKRAASPADEDELSRRALVENEWDPAENGTTAGSSAGSPSGPLNSHSKPSSGRDEPDSQESTCSGGHSLVANCGRRHWYDSSSE